MALTYGFFDAVQTAGGGYDRTYNAEQMSKYFKGLFTDGVIANVGQSLAVSATTGMIIQVGTGRAFTDCRWMENDTILDLTVPAAHAVLPRKDIVVVSLDYEERWIDIMVRKGTAASEPTAPEIRRNTAYYEIELAEIYVPAGATSITQSRITDKRADQSVCGYVTGLIDQIDTETIWSQLTTSFDEWFENIREQLDTDAEGHLQNEIERIWANFAVIEYAMVATQNYNAGDYIIVEGSLYRATAAISSGDPIVYGTNVVTPALGIDIANSTIYLTGVEISALPGAIGQLATVVDPRITEQHVVASISFASPASITEAVSWTTWNGGLILDGSSAAATTANIVLVKKSS